MSKPSKIARATRVKDGAPVVRRILLALCLCLLATYADRGARAAPGRLTPQQLAIIVNDDDPLSLRVGAYYQASRGVPAGNVIHIRFTPGRQALSRAEFEPLKARVDAMTPDAIQAYALTWSAPYRVDCMSITTAFAAGFDEEFCSRDGCTPTRPNAYYNYPGHMPWSDLKVRPTMVLAGADFDQVKALIDRGVRADGTAPRGQGYLLITPDRLRMSRLFQYVPALEVSRGRVAMKVLERPYLEHRSDVMFYFLGAEFVPGLDTLRFRPGAVADHLTSTGGQVTGGPQMSAMRWLEAGATGSYGNVIEPCNYPNKFPNIPVFLSHYLAGETLLEAYWKSVDWPGEGLFIGEPLAAPYATGVRRRN